MKYKAKKTTETKEIGYKEGETFDVVKYVVKEINYCCQDLKNCMNNTSTYREHGTFEYQDHNGLMYINNIFLSGEHFVGEENWVLRYCPFCGSKVEKIFIIHIEERHFEKMLREVVEMENMYLEKGENNPENMIEKMLEEAEYIGEEEEIFAMYVVLFGKYYQEKECIGRIKNSYKTWKQNFEITVSPEIDPMWTSLTKGLE